MAEKISGRFQTPADKDGNRTDIHPITSSDEVLLSDAVNGGTGKTLTDYIKNNTFVISEKNGPVPAGPCFRFKKK